MSALVKLQVSDAYTHTPNQTLNHSFS